jgi:hypothetical protein
MRKNDVKIIKKKVKKIKISKIMTHLIETYSQNPKPKRLVLPESTILRVELILGNPQVECRRFGICKMDIWDRKKKYFISKSYNHTLAIMHIEYKSAHILLKFMPDRMDALTLQQFFGNEEFILESDFHFSTASGLPKVYKPFVIAQGSYEVENTSQYLVVRLPYTSKMDTS